MMARAITAGRASAGRGAAQPGAITCLRQLDNALAAHQLRHDAHHFLCLLHVLLNVYR